jgi:magnesium transporter
MNFDVIPELSWRHGYFALLAFMGLLTTTLLIVFRIKRWI